MRHAAPLRAWPLLAALTSALLLLVSCRAVADRLSGQDDPAPAPSIPLAWKPAGARPAVKLSSPGDGGTRTIRVGDRVTLSRSGLRLEDWRGILVPYGGDRTYLAVGTGRVEAEETVYDEDRPCVPPRTVAEFDLVVGPGHAPTIPAPRHLGPESGKSVTLVPGQAFTHPRGWTLYVTTGKDSVLTVRTPSDHGAYSDGSYAVRPGTARVTLAPPDHASSARKQSVRLRVVDPDSRPVRPHARRSPTTPVTAAPGDTAAAPAPLPACA